MTKLAIVALNEHFERSWLDTKIFEELSEIYELDVFTCFQNDLKVKNVNITLSVEEKYLKQIAILRNLAWITYRSKCSSFEFGLERSFLSDFYWIQKQFQFKKKLYFFLQSLKNFVKIFTSNKFNWFYFFPIKQQIFRILLNRLEPHIGLKNTFTKYDLVILHSCMMEPYLPIILNSIKDTNTKSLMVLENWDNLTSKQVLFINPDHVGVMGEVDKKNVIEIHNFSQEEVHNIGLPKFDILGKFKYRPKSRSLKSIVYVGFSLPHDEIQFLNRLQSRLDKDGENFKLHYRPHPAAKRRLSDTILDSRISITTLGKKASLYKFDDNYLNDVLDADFVIGAPTTFMLEVMQLGIPSFIDLTDDKIHRTTSANASKRYLHMSQFVDLFRNYTFSNIDELMNLLKSGPYETDNYLEDMEKLVTIDNKSYSSRLNEVITKILCRPSV